MAKINPLEFARQVEAERKKISWPSQRETIMTAIMVIIMASMLGIFFLGVDSLFDAFVRFLLSLAK